MAVNEDADDVDWRTAGLMSLCFLPHTLEKLFGIYTESFKALESGIVLHFFRPASSNITVEW